MSINAAAVQKSAIATSWLIAGMAIGAEVYAPLKTSLTSLAGQHWTGKSVVAVAVFIIFYWVLRRTSTANTFTYAILLALSAVAGGVAIFGFFVWHFLSL